jgi:predicted unusual protein kinase regulating ubiquinone biosynthesis (AarF/ABC1/UbiB family)
MDDRIDDERNRLSGRLSRYVRVGTNVGGVAARVAASRLFNRSGDDASNAKALTAALGGLKGPLMKVAQLMATIPDLLPPEYAAELQSLQSDAPPMGWVFVKRRMSAELGPDWDKRFQSFEKTPAAAASLGQVHRAVATDGTPLAIKLQYPDMQSAVEADLSQLKALFALHRQFDSAINTSEVYKELGARVREELDYEREAKHAALYAQMLAREKSVRVPTIRTDLSTRRLLTMGWLEGTKLLTHKQDNEAERNRIAEALFTAWWLPFSQYGVIHGDPHLGNYTVFTEDGRAAGINLLDYGCIRLFPVRFIGAVVDLYRGLFTNERARIDHAYETLGFRGLNRDLTAVLDIWARFILGPLLDDRTRTIADGVSAAEYGRKEAFQVHQELKRKGPVTIPQEFVFMDRAAIGLGGVFLHLDARLNFHQLFEEKLEGFSLEKLKARQTKALSSVGLSVPE